MRTPHWIVVVVLALIVGGTVGYIAAPGDSEQESTHHQSLEEVHRERSGPEIPLISEVNDPVHTPNVDLATSKDAESPDGPDWLAEVELHGLKPGSETVTIRVVDQHGMPVHGFEIGLRLWSTDDEVDYPQRGDFATEDEYIIAKVRHNYISMKLEQRRTLKQKSTAEGIVAFTGLPAVTASLAISTWDYLIEGRFSTMSRPVELGADFELMVMPARRVEILVESSVKPEGASCRVEWNCGDYSSGTSAKVGETFTDIVPKGDVKFTAIAARDSKDLESVTINVGDNTETVHLKLGDNSALHGVVRFLGPRPLSFHVRMAKVLGSASDEELLKSSHEFRSMNVDIDKSTDSYVIYDDLDGEHVIAVMGNSGILVSTRVMLGLESVELDLEVPEPDSSRGTIVVVQRPEGLKISNEQFGFRDPITSQGLAYETWSFSKTRYLLLPIQRESEPLPAEVIVSLSSSTLGVVEQRVRMGVDREVTLTFIEPCEVTLTLKNVPGNLTWPTVQYSCGPDFTLWHGKHFGSPSGASRTARFGSFQPGSYRIRVSSGHHEAWILGETDVVLEAGKQTVELALSKLHDVIIDGSSCQPYTHANLKHIESDVQKHFTFTDGHTAMFGGLPSGTYEVTYTANGINGNKKTVKFTLPGSDTVILTGD